MSQTEMQAGVKSQQGTAGPETVRHLDLADRYSARNYAPIPVVVKRGEGSWVEDVDGKRYLEFLSGYSALNFGHAHPKITSAFVEQAKRLTLTSRAFNNDQFGPFSEEITSLCKLDLVLPMNTGAEAVETAIKTARKWGYMVKGVEPDKAEIICFKNNFHGRTITVVSFSTGCQARKDFGPFTPGFSLVDYGDAAAVEAAITPNTVAVLIEPIQGEGGVLIPPDGYLPAVRELCTKHNVLFIADEIQTGLGRTGRLFCCDHENVKPDALILGKALGGGMMPVSAVVGTKEVLGVFKPYDHGSTFGGNPLACAVARAAIRVLVDEKLSERAAKLGPPLMERLRQINSPVVREVRGRGLLIGIELTPDSGGAGKYSRRLAELGVLSKETGESVIRIAPPLNISEEDLEWGYERIARVLTEPV
jgi:ornithine--oxo-acid transaminase